LTGPNKVLFDNLRVLQERAARCAAMNMALDEAIVRAATLPTLRFYRWKTRAVSFGYFGRFAEAEGFADGRDLVRRWTGGGIVPHDDDHDVTYSIMVPASSDAFRLSSLEIYQRIHEALSAALLQRGVSATLTQWAPPKVSDACFANPVAADVMLEGRKIAGAAHRRGKQCLLHQGSIQLHLEEAFQKSFAQALASYCETGEIDDEIERAALSIAAQKYGAPEWNRRR